MQEYPNYQDIVLVGGGHAHTIVLRMWAMNPLPGARLTLVSPQMQTAYSGMLPGLVAGHYRTDEIHIDLARLCRAAGARFIQASARHIDLHQRSISLADRPELEFDLLSLDVGATPARDIPGSELAIPVKPVGDFHRHWQQLQEQMRNSGAPLKLGVVGGGAGGCELAMAVSHTLGDRAEIHLVHNSDRLPEQYPPLARTLVSREMDRLGIQVHRNWPVAEITGGGLRSEDGRTLALDRVLLCTQASAPTWLAGSGLALDERGFVLVDEKLRAQGRANIFAVGDVASFAEQPLPKAGVYAVRQGPVLFHNLRAALIGKPLKGFRPQRHFLSLLSCGGKRAVAVRNGLAVAGGGLWRWKNHIDRAFMRRFSELPMIMEPPRRPREIIGERSGIALEKMRCSGCGAKVGAQVLNRALEKLPPQQSPYLRRGAGDDAAVMDLPHGKLLVQSSDQLRALVSDPWLFGRLAALHALSDLFAMHAQPVAAQALVTLPLATAELARRDLQQLLDGAALELNRHHCALSGGHTAEGAELQLGLTVNGIADPEQLLEKTGASPGDCLVLSKPLGVGTLFAAEGLGKARSRWLQEALQTMLQSNAAAAEIFARHSARALTDITGFGLLGHLLEMLGLDYAGGGTGPLGATLIAENLPLLSGAAHCAEQGWLSSLQPQNATAYGSVDNPGEWGALPHWALLTDPQTCGGLLAAIPAAQAEKCVRALQLAGCERAAIVGVVNTAGGRPIRLARKVDWQQLAAQSETIL
ncbi:MULTISPECIES: selenide, water dikinase SelD [unclassified Microbulbifer]|uniref:selenide, water dikinase SelD n=1 Tax=unclassified Microbulbifer TaxID=2619833 RepID=UPI0027E3BACD|nr:MULTISPECIES: selenide, water dikinase SelD [unclassified Microbulbifer]